MSDLFTTPTTWRSRVNHDSPKARRIKAAVQAIHARGEYPGCRRVQREIGEELYRLSHVDAGLDILIQTPRRMSGRDNVVRKAEMVRLGIQPEPYLWDDDGDDWGYGRY